MANNGFRHIIISFLLVGLFFFAMISFGVQLAIQNDANSSLLNNEVINSTFSNIEDDLGDAEDTAQTQRENVESEVPTVATGAFLLVSIIAAGKVLTSTGIGVFNLLAGAITEVLGIPTIVLGTISAILIISLVFLAWRFYKAGE